MNSDLGYQKDLNNIHVTQYMNEGINNYVGVSNIHRTRTMLILFRCNEKRNTKVREKQPKIERKAYKLRTDFCIMGKIQLWQILFCKDKLCL